MSNGEDKKDRPAPTPIREERTPGRAERINESTDPDAAPRPRHDFVNKSRTDAGTGNRKRDK